MPNSQSPPHTRSRTARARAAAQLPPATRPMSAQDRITAQTRYAVVENQRRRAESQRNGTRFERYVIDANTPVVAVPPAAVRSPRAVSPPAAAAVPPARRPRIDAQEMVRNQTRQTFLENRARRLGQLNNDIVAAIAPIIARTPRAPRAARTPRPPALPRMPTASRRAIESALTTSTRTRENINILEQQISNLSNVRDIISAYLNTDQIRYINSTETANYYYRRRELLYRGLIDFFIESQGTISQMDGNIGFNGLNNGFSDILLYEEIKNVITTIKNEIRSLSNKDNVQRDVTNEITLNILDEITLLTTFINDLEHNTTGVVFEPQAELLIAQFLESARARLEQLRRIIRDPENIRDIVEGLEHKRAYLLDFAKSIKILAETYNILVKSVTLLPIDGVDGVFQYIQKAVDKSLGVVMSGSDIIDNIENRAALPNLIREFDNKVKEQKEYLKEIKRKDFYRRSQQLYNNRLEFYERRLANERRQRTRAAATAATAARRATAAAATEARRVRTTPANRRTTRPSTAAIATATRRAQGQPQAINFVITELLSLVTDQECSDKFTGILGDNLIDHCKGYNKVLNLRDTRYNAAVLKEKFSMRFNDNEPLRIGIPSISNYVNNSIASLFGRYVRNGGDLAFNDLPRYFIVNKILIENPENPNDITVEQQHGIDAGGLRRDFVTALTTELFSKKIFTTRDGTKKYFLNPEFKPDHLFTFVVKKNVPNFNFDDNDDSAMFYKFLGVLLSFILVNECGLEYNISLSILTKFRYNGVLDKYDYMYFMVDEFPEFSGSLINLMRQPENIEYTYLSYNDNYYLTDTPEDIDVTSENFEDYFTKVAYFMMTKMILRKDIEVTKNSDESIEAFNERYKKLAERGEFIYNNFVDGIPSDIIITLNESHLPLKTLDAYMTAGNMSIEIVEDIKNNFNATMTHIIGTLHGVNKDLTIRMKELFISHVLTKRPEMSDDDFLAFITKLLRFWSGTTFFKRGEHYKIAINNGLSINHLPQSHTCFFLIDVPFYNDGPILHDKINIAISNVEVGIGLSGGKRKKNKKSKSMKKNQKKIT